MSEPILDLHQFLQPNSHYPPDLLFHVTSPKLGTTTLLNAHKIFLAEASPIFKRQFYGGGFFRPIEGEGLLEVKLDDVEPEVFSQFLHLIYSTNDNSSLSWTCNNMQGLENLFGLLKLVDYHFHDGQHKPMVILKERAMKPFKEISIADDDLDVDNYIEIADNYSFLEEAHKIVIEKVFQLKCLHQFSTTKFGRMIVGIAKDLNPRNKQNKFRPRSLISTEQRENLARSLPQTEDDVPYELRNYNKPILRVTQFIQSEKAKHMNVDVVEKVTNTNEAAELPKIELDPEIEENRLQAKILQDIETEVAPPINVVSVLEPADRFVPKQKVEQCSGRIGPLVHFSVRTKPEAFKEQIEIVADMLLREFAGQRGLIVTNTRKEAETLVLDIKERGGVSLGFADSWDDKGLAVEEWLEGTTNVVVTAYMRERVCARAAGTRVSFIVHLIMPSSMARFFQDISVLSDDIPAKSVMFWQLDDYRKQSEGYSGGDYGFGLTITTHLHGMVSYCIELDTCRVKILCTHLQDKVVDVVDRCGGDNCDNCKAGQGTDVTKYVVEVLRILVAAKEKSINVTMKQIVDCLMGKGLTTLRLEGWEGSNLALEQVETVVAKMVVDKFVWDKVKKYAMRSVTYIEAADREVEGTVRMKLRDVNFINYIKKRVRVGKEKKKDN